MRYTDFLGATGDIIALVSIGKANKSWYPKIQEYNSTFEGIVVGYQLYTNDDGSFRYKIVDYSSSRRIMRNLCKYQYQYHVFIITMQQQTDLLFFLLYFGH